MSIRSLSARACAAVLMAGVVALAGVTTADARPHAVDGDRGPSGGSADGSQLYGLGEDFVLNRAESDPLAELRRESLAAERRGAPVIHHVHASIVTVTDDVSDDNKALADLSFAKVAAAVKQLNDYFMEESGGRIGFDLAGYETRSWHRASCTRGGGLALAEELSFDGVAEDPAWAAANNHVWALTLEGGQTCGGGIALLPGHVVFQNEGVEDVFVPDRPGEMAGITVMLHEFGHNLGFGHADAGICRSAVGFDAPLAQWWDTFEDPDARCPYLEYGDWQDMMGFSEVDQRMHISALQRYLAGWLEGSTVTPELGTSSILLKPLDDLSGIRAIPVTDPRTGELYVIEYRTASGADATSQEFTSPIRDEGLALRYFYPALPDSNGDTFARWAIDTPEETGGVRVLRLLYGPNDTTRHNADFPFFQESLVLAVGTSTFYPDVYNRNAHLDAGESFTSYSGGIRLDVDSLDSSAGAQLRVTTTRAPSTTKVTVADTTLSKRQKPALTVRVSAPTAAQVTGDVVAKVDGAVVRTFRLTGTKGTATFTIPAIKRTGRHKISVGFVGSAAVDPSTSRSVSVTVRR